MAIVTPAPGALNTSFSTTGPPSAGLVLIPKAVTGDHDGLIPVLHDPRDVRADDRLAEDRPVQDVSDGPVRRRVHPFQPELLHPGLVGGDGGALDRNPVFLGGLGRFERNLIVGGVPVLDAKVKVLEVDVEVGQNQLLADLLPDDPGHLVPIHLDDRVFHSDLRHERLRDQAARFWLGR
jgi:hypothetical protein